MKEKIDEAKAVFERLANDLLYLVAQGVSAIPLAFALLFAVLIIFAPDVFRPFQAMHWEQIVISLHIPREAAGKWIFSMARALQNVFLVCWAVAWFFRMVALQENPFDQESKKGKKSDGRALEARQVVGDLSD